MNVKELALLPNARRKRADNMLDNIDVTQAFIQVVKELKSLFNIK